MGQQQLLLLALSTIIVGLAIVVGLNMFGENAGQANQNAVTNDVLTIASRAQGWYRKPAQFGGGGRSFAAVTLDTLGFPPTNPNGTYALSNLSVDSLVITGTGVENPDGVGGNLSVAVTVKANTVSSATITQ
ncbi:MAG: hypothetical protein ACE5I1_24565 [bacterium]